MTNRERIITGIKRLRGHKPGSYRAAELELLLEKLNHRARKKLDTHPLFIGSIILIFPIIVITKTPSIVRNAPSWIAFPAVFGALFIFGWIWHYFPKRLNLNWIYINKECIRCGYNLEGHDSLLGDDLWVGPEICPECGQTYPAIG